MNNQPFSHKAGVDVPDDVKMNVRRLVVGGSESEGVVEADDFDEYGNLERLELREGTLKIGREAFLFCLALRRVDPPPSLHTIDIDAFAGCESLSEMKLPKGLRWIRSGAFQGHSFQQITIPSSVREIGVEAFTEGDHLSEVTLAGGTVLVGCNAFEKCPQLRNIATPSIAIVVEDGLHGNGRAEVVTGGRIAVREWEPTRLILTSPYLASMQSDDDETEVTDVTRVRDAIHSIAGGQPPGEGPLDLAVEDDGEWDEDDWIRVQESANRIFSHFLGLLSAHRRALASILKSAPLWKSEGVSFESGVVKVILSFLGDVEG